MAGVTSDEKDEGAGDEKRLDQFGPITIFHFQQGSADAYNSIRNEETEVPVDNSEA